MYGRDGKLMYLRPWYVVLWHAESFECIAALILPLLSRNEVGDFD